jgi:hypothetical protein
MCECLKNCSILYRPKNPDTSKIRTHSQRWRCYRPKAEYMSTDSTQLNSTGKILNMCWRLVSFMSVKLNSTQLNSTQHNATQHNSTQLNSTGFFRHVLDLKLNSTQLICALRRQSSSVLSSRDPVE